MKEDYTIKRITSSKLTEPQIRRIAELWRQLDDAENEYDAPHGLKMRHTSNNGLRQYLQKDNEGVTAAVGKDGKILGFARNFPAREYGNVNYISALSVDKDNRGQGIGRALLQNIVRSNRRKKRLSMLRVSLNNPAGLHLYGSMGFKPVSQTMVLGEGQEKEAGFKPQTSLRVVRGLVADLLRNKPRPVPFSRVVDDAAGSAVFRGSTKLPALQELHALKSEGIRKRDLYSHVSPSSQVISEYGGTYAIDGQMPGRGRRRGFLQVISSGLGKLKSGKQRFYGDFGAERDLGTVVPKHLQASTAAHNRAVLSDPYRRGVEHDFETVLPVRSLADARVYSASVLPGFVGHLRSADVDHMMLTDVTRINRLAKIRERHPEFAGVIDPVIGRYLPSRNSSGRAVLRGIAQQYVPHGTAGSGMFRTPETWKLPRYLRSIV